jgi:CBS-domain-containing membrane protein
VRIYDLMTREVVSVRPETPLKEVAQLLVDHGIGGVPVTDSMGIVLGVVSESDFVTKELGREYARRSRLARLFGQPSPDAAKIEATTAAEAMTAPAVTIEGRIATVREAAIVMAEHGINRLPVIEDGRLVGIITRGDLVRIFAESDGILAERVGRRLHAVDGLAVDEVRNGVVTLSGTVESQELAKTAIEIARTTDGVVGVDAERVAWRSAREPVWPGIG